MAHAAPRTVEIAVRGPVRHRDLAGLERRVEGLLQRCAPDVVHCDVGAARADAATVDALARLQLAAQRRRCRIVLCEATDELLALVDLMGLREALPVEPRR
jgi:ABC-type transporter Mla MlaB component